LTGEERRVIEEIKEAHPHYRHRRIQGVLQQKGVYLSASVIYGHLKQRGWVEPYDRRAAPWKSPRYEVWQRNLMWGSDWTRLSVSGVRWYLLTVIDFFSRLIVAYEVVPTVHAGYVKAVYQAGLKAQGISLRSERKPDLRVDRGSPNTSGVTREFFAALGAELSFARVRRPTDNAITERFYGTVKQEEIYLVGNYPDEISAREEIGRYIQFYNQSRPHQALYNFTPAHVHEVNNKSALLQELNEMKSKTREKRKAYWVERSQERQLSIEGGCPGKGRGEIVDPGAYTEEIFDRQQPDFQKASDSDQKK
jgi:transposase InsO family protein